MTLRYPDEPLDDLPAPPVTFTDGDGRSIEIKQATDECIEPLVEMYLKFDSQDRAQGIPPSGEEPIRKWLNIVTEDKSLNVIAWDGDEAVGHAMLVADDDGSYELAIFVIQSHQNAGIGTELLRTALGEGQSQGINRVWLSVERWNKPAIAVYEKIGFERMDDTSFERQMTVRLGAE